MSEKDKIALLRKEFFNNIDKFKPVDIVVDKSYWNGKFSNDSKSFYLKGEKRPYEYKNLSKKEKDKKTLNIVKKLLKRCLALVKTTKN